MYTYVNDYDFDIFIIIDADMFLIDYVDFLDYTNNDIYFVPQSREKNGIIINYMWNGMLILNNKNIKDLDKLNFDCGQVCGVSTDVGGPTHLWLEKYKDQKI